MMHKIERDNTGRMKAGQDLVAAGYAGLAGTMKIIKEKRELLRPWFSEDYLDWTLSENRAVHIPDLRTGRFTDPDITDAEAVGEGGILAAIWNFSGAYELGVEFVLRDIPLRQETIEVCERLELNPYRLYSADCYLLSSYNGGRLVRRLNGEGIPSAVIGSVTSGNGREIILAESRGYLERPRRDELKKIIRRQSS